jgi:MarR family transcriptional regulator for hemolysin
MKDRIEGTLIKTVSETLSESQNEGLKEGLNESFGFALHDVARLLRWTFDRQSQSLGLTRAQWSVLAHLYRAEGVQQKTLAQLMDVAPITLARQLDRLETDSWIERRDDPQDRRAKLIYLTVKSKPMIKQLSKLGKRVREQALAGISTIDREVFMTTLLSIRENLSKDCD